MSYVAKPEMACDASTVENDAFLLEQATINDSTQLIGNGRMFGNATATGKSKIGGWVYDHSSVNDATIEPTGRVFGWAAVIEATIAGVVRDRASVHSAFVPKSTTIGGYAQISGVFDVPHEATIVGDAAVTAEDHVMVERVSPTRVVTFYRSIRHGLECCDVTDGKITYSGPLDGFGGKSPGPLERSLATKARNAIETGTP